MFQQIFCRYNSFQFHANRAQSRPRPHKLVPYNFININSAQPHKTRGQPMQIRPTRPTTFVCAITTIQMPRHVSKATAGKRADKTNSPKKGAGKWKWAYLISWQNIFHTHKCAGFRLASTFVWARLTANCLHMSSIIINRFSGATRTRPKKCLWAIHLSRG